MHLSQLKITAFEYRAFEFLRQRSTTNANNYLGAIESNWLCELETSYQYHQHISTAEWKAKEKLKIEAEFSTVQINLLRRF